MEYQNGLNEILRTYLKKNDIKLWLKPYTNDDGSQGIIPLDLLESIGNNFNLDESTIINILEELRLHSVYKFAAQKKFNETGIAQLRIKIAGSPQNIISPVDLNKEIVIEIEIIANGHQLINKLSELTGIPGNWIKLIYNGSSLQPDNSLAAQNVKNFSQILGLCLSSFEIDKLLEEENSSQVNKIKKATQFLIESNNNDVDDDSRYHLQIADQSGRPIDIPKDEQKSLTLAMMMHEKGRTALKNKNFGLALTYLLESENEFMKCSSNILDSVDNFALVSLDVVWCYFCLQNVSYLPDAEKKLQLAEKSFIRSYGANMERVSTLKGSCLQEKVLFLRLHILQAVLSFHKGEDRKCALLLEKANEELKLLKVDENSLMQIVEMGFDLRESRLALRFTNGDITKAVAHITKLKEEKIALDKKEKENKKIKLLEKKLGFTNYGSKVNASYYTNLVSMGFDRRAVFWALKETDNDFFESLKHIHENSTIDLSSLVDPEASPIAPITSDMIGCLVAMGYDEISARAALNHFGGDLEVAARELLDNNGLAKSEWLVNDSNKASSKTSDAELETTSVSSDQSMNPVASSSTQEVENTIREEIIPDISDQFDDYLDLDLEEEASVIAEYMARVLSQDF